MRLGITSVLIIKFFHNFNDKIFKDTVSHSLGLYLNWLAKMFLKTKTSFSKRKYPYKPNEMLIFVTIFLISL